MKKPSNIYCSLAQAEASFHERSNEILNEALAESFASGMDYGLGQVLPNIETIAANLDNNNMTDTDFRAFIKTIIPDLIERIKE